MGRRSRRVSFPNPSELLKQEKPEPYFEVAKQLLDCLNAGIIRILDSRKGWSFVKARRQSLMAINRQIALASEAATQNLRKEVARDKMLRRKYSNNSNSLEEVLLRSLGGAQPHMQTKVLVCLAKLIALGRVKITAYGNPLDKLPSFVRAYEGSSNISAEGDGEKVLDELERQLLAIVQARAGMEGANVADITNAAGDVSFLMHALRTAPPLKADSSASSLFYRPSLAANRPSIDLTVSRAGPGSVPFGQHLSVAPSPTVTVTTSGPSPSTTPPSESPATPTPAQEPSADAAPAIGQPSPRPSHTAAFHLTITPSDHHSDSNLEPSPAPRPRAASPEALLDTGPPAASFPVTPPSSASTSHAQRHVRLEPPGDEEQQQQSSMADVVVLRGVSSGGLSWDKRRRDPSGEARLHGHVPDYLAQTLRDFRALQHTQRERDALAAAARPPASIRADQPSSSLSLAATGPLLSSSDLGASRALLVSSAVAELKNQGVLLNRLASPNTLPSAPSAPPAPPPPIAPHPAMTRTSSRRSLVSSSSSTLQPRAPPQRRPTGRASAVSGLLAESGGGQLGHIAEADAHAPDQAAEASALSSRNSLATGRRRTSAQLERLGSSASLAASAYGAMQQQRKQPSPDAEMYAASDASGRGGGGQGWPNSEHTSDPTLSSTVSLLSKPPAQSDAPSEAMPRQSLLFRFVDPLKEHFARVYRQQRNEMCHQQRPDPLSARSAPDDLPSLRTRTRRFASSLY